jgi:hypothetical protein
MSSHSLGRPRRSPRRSRRTQTEKSITHTEAASRAIPATGMGSAPYPTSTHSGVTTHLRATHQVGNAQLMIIQTRLNRVEIKSKMRVTGSSFFKHWASWKSLVFGCNCKVGKTLQDSKWPLRRRIDRKLAWLFHIHDACFIRKAGVSRMPEGSFTDRATLNGQAPLRGPLHRGSARCDRADGLRDECEGNVSKERRRDGGRSFCSHAQQPVAAFDGTSLGMKSSSRTAYATPEDRAVSRTRPGSGFPGCAIRPRGRTERGIHARNRAQPSHRTPQPVVDQGPMASRTHRDGARGPSRL